LNEAIAVRNLIVHRRGRVDQTFINETRRRDLVVDGVIRITSDETQKAWIVVGTAQRKIADAIGTKFDFNRPGPGGERFPKEVPPEV